MKLTDFAGQKFGGMRVLAARAIGISQAQFNNYVSQGREVYYISEIDKWILPTKRSKFC